MNVNVAEAVAVLTGQKRLHNRKILHREILYD